MLVPVAYAAPMWTRAGNIFAFAVQTRHRRERIWVVFAGILLSGLAATATAQLNGLLKKIDPTPALKQRLSQQLGEAMGVGSPLLLDQKNSYPLAVAPQNFSPLKLSSMADLNRPLEPGDYSVDVIFFCTQWSIHAPGQGNPYKLGPANGKLAKPICALLYRGMLHHIDPSRLNANAWRIQAGVPLAQFSKDDQELVHSLVPDYEENLKGDWFQKLKGSFDSTLRLLTHKSFDETLTGMGDPGKALLNLERSRAVLQDQTQHSERLPEMLYQKTGDGTPYQLPPDKGHPSPWMQIQPNVVARFTDISGNLNTNLMEFRVLPAGSQPIKGALASLDTPQTKGPFVDVDSLANTFPKQAGATTLAGLFGGVDGSSGTVGYPIGTGAQCPVLEPILSGSPPANGGPIGGGPSSGGPTAGGRPKEPGNGNGTGPGPGPGNGNGNGTGPSNPGTNPNPGGTAPPLTSRDKLHVRLVWLVETLRVGFRYFHPDAGSQSGLLSFNALPSGVSEAISLTAGVTQRKRASFTLTSYGPLDGRLASSGGEKPGWAFDTPNAQGNDGWAFSDMLGLYTKLQARSGKSARYLLSSDGVTNNFGYLDAILVKGSDGPPVVYPYQILVAWHAHDPKSGIVIGGTTTYTIHGELGPDTYSILLSLKLTIPDPDGGKPANCDLSISYNKDSKQQSVTGSVFVTNTKDGSFVGTISLNQLPDKSWKVNISATLPSNGSPGTVNGNITVRPDGSGSGTVSSAESEGQVKISFTKDGKYIENYESGPPYHAQLP